jgi:hypothetical protein
MKQLVDLVAEATEIGGVERRLDFHRPDPFAPGHDPDPRNLDG